MRGSARRMVKTMNRKLCPILAASAAIEKSEGKCECIEDRCQLWCDEGKWTVFDSMGKPEGYRSGCGLMPKENRKL